MAAYYNEIDPYAAQWLRNLISKNLIAPGEVDERSIEDVTPDELRTFTQCHFFAGIGVWSYALRNAGWDDERPVWTGSCPCQPFSAAGKGGGFDDERHLWPAWFHLIGERRPPKVFGEQVASKDGLGWLDLVQTDMEGAGYAFGAVDTCSAGSGAPHIRQRLRFVAEGLEHAPRHGRSERRPEPVRGSLVGGRSDGGMADTASSRQPGESGSGRTQELGTPERGLSGGMADADSRELDGQSVVRGLERDRQDARWSQGSGEPEPCVDDGRLGDATDEPRERDARGVSRAETQEHGARLAVDGFEYIGPEHASAGLAPRPGPTNGFWRDADWLFCTDGKWRPVEPCTFPLAHGAPSRVGRLRAYGNAVDAEATRHFVEAVMEAEKFL